MDPMKPHSALEIGNEFLQRSFDAGGSITQMHVQKFVYLAHGYYLAETDYPLIAETFEAWTFGPVVRRLYDALKGYGRDPIERLISWGDDSPFGFDRIDKPARAILRNSETEVVETVWKAYSRFKAFELSALTHMEGTPWAHRYEPGKNNIIENFRIQQYFQAL